MRKKQIVVQKLRKMFMVGLLILFAKTIASTECVLAESVKITEPIITAKAGVSAKYVEYEDYSIAGIEQAFQPGYIFVGDSRFVGMDMVVNVEAEKNQFLIAECGKGYQWLKDTAEIQMNAICAAHPEITDWYLVTNLGVNDRYNKSAYVEEYEKLAEEYTILFVSVNPLETVAGTAANKITETNAEVNDFNSTICKMDYISYYIDTYTYMMQNGFETVDGLHYTNTTYQNIYDYIESSINIIEALQDR